MAERSRTPLLERRLLYVTGKGGVGKTTIAAALAVAAASTGKRVLVCDVDGKGDMAPVFGASTPIGWDPAELRPRIHVMSMDTEESLREYLKMTLRLPVMPKIGPLAKIFEFVATGAPGVKEILSVGKLAYEVRERNYDLVIADAPATGHVIAQLDAPKAIGELVGLGLLNDETRWMSEILDDPALTGAIVVTTTEELPVSETIELVGRLDRETDIDLAAVIVNRVLPELFNRPEQEVFDALGSPEAKKNLEELVGGSHDTVFEAARHLTELRRSRARHLGSLRDGLAAAGDIPALVHLPEQFVIEAPGANDVSTDAAALIDQLAEALNDELAT